MIQAITFYNNPNDILKANIGETVNRRHTYDDWHILASERPVFTPPEVKTNYVDVPGGHGSLDLTESLTKYPTYKNRTGSFKFRVMNDYMKDGKIIYESNTQGRWAERYSEIMEYLHGKYLYAVLDDDPDWFYKGRFAVEGWNPADTWSELTIKYEVNPFKWNKYSSTSEWLWDPFNFETGVIWDVACNDIEINSPEKFTKILLPPYVLDEKSMSTFFGGVAVSPTIIFAPPSGSIDKGVDIRFVNKYLGIDITQHFRAGATPAPDFIFYGQTEPYEMHLKGVGTVSIDFRVGRL